MLQNILIQINNWCVMYAHFIAFIIYILFL